MQVDAPSRVIQRDEMREQIQQEIQQSLRDAGVAPPGVTAVGGTEQPVWLQPLDMPVRVQETAFAFFLMIVLVVIGFPIARAIGRRIDRAGETRKIPNEVTAQLVQLNQAVEAIAVEVERISEGQRFTTKLLADQHKLPPASRDIS